MKMPIWTPGKPAHFGERYFVYSPKLRRIVSVSSKLEFEQMLLLEFDPSVASYCEQPAVAEAIIDGQWLRSRFDFTVQDLSGRSRFLEVKYASELRDPRSRAHRQIAIQKEWCRRRGYDHAVVTDTQIWASPTRINSLRALLYEYTARFTQTVGLAEPLLPLAFSIIKSHPGVPIGAVLGRRPPHARPEVWRLAVMELIRRDTVDASLNSVAFSPRSPLRAKEGGVQ